MATKSKKKDEALETVTHGALVRPSFVEDSTAGTEDIGSDDLKLPCLKIAQGLSPQMLPDDSARIEGLELFQMFNDLTSQIYGKDPVTFIVVQRQVKRIEFDPDDRKIPIDLEVPARDPRMNWTKDDEGKGVPPRATKFVEFVLLLMNDTDEPPEPVVLSIQETNKFSKKAHERLSGFIKLRRPPAPIYAGLYTMRPVSEKNDKGTFGVAVIDNAGYVADPKMYASAKAFSESLKGKTIIIEREDTFDPEQMDREPGADDGEM